MRYLKQNTATVITVGPFLDVTDGITPEVALTVTNDHLTLMVDNAGTPTLALDADATASGGNNDMVHVTNDDAGMYTLELTAAQLNYVGGAILAIIDTDVHLPVFHEFTILPANVYDSLIAGSDLLDANASQLGGTAQSGRDIGASVLLSAGTGAGQLDFTSGVVKANLAQILGTALTETAGQIAAAFKKFFDKAAPTGTINSLPDAVAGANGGLPVLNAALEVPKVKALTDAPPNSAGVTTMVADYARRTGDYSTYAGTDTAGTTELLTRIPDAAPGASGGLPILNASLEVPKVKTLTDAPVDSAGVTTLLNRVGAFTGTGINTVLGFLKALLSKAASAPSDIGGTFDPSTDSVEAIRDTAPLGTAMRGTDGAMLAGATPTVGGYAAGQDPATLILVTPANKINTDAANAVKIQKMAVTVAPADVSGNLPADLKAITVGVDLSAVMKASVTAAVPTAAANADAVFDEAAATHTGLIATALPNVAPGANGGLPTTNGSKLNQTADLTAGQSIAVSDKTGFKLASDGLDTVATTAPTGVASNFREMLVQVWRRWFKKSTLTDSELKTYDDAGTGVLTTQAVSDDGSVQTQGSAT